MAKYCLVGTKYWLDFYLTCDIKITEHIFRHR